VQESESWSRTSIVVERLLEFEVVSEELKEGREDEEGVGKRRLALPSPNS